MILRRNILCLDVGLCNTGVAVWDVRLRKFIYSEVIKTAKEEGSVAQDNVRRCAFVFRRLRKLGRAFNPRLVIAEVPMGGGKSYHAVVSMCMVTAILACFVAAEEVEFFPVTPNEVKRIVANSRKVSKEQVQKFVAYRFGTTFLPKLLGEREHVADAMAAFAVYQQKRSYAKV